MEFQKISIIFDVEWRWFVFAMILFFLGYLATFKPKDLLELKTYREELRIIFRSLFIGMIMASIIIFAALIGNTAIQMGCSDGKCFYNKMLSEKK